MAVVRAEPMAGRPGWAAMAIGEERHFPIETSLPSTMPWKATRRWPVSAHVCQGSRLSRRPPANGRKVRAATA